MYIMHINQMKTTASLVSLVNHASHSLQWRTSVKLFSHWAPHLQWIP